MLRLPCKIKIKISRLLYLKIYLHGADLSGLHAFISPEVLPTEYGGIAGNFDNRPWHLQLLVDEDYFKSQLVYGYKVDVNSENWSFKLYLIKHQPVSVVVDVIQFFLRRFSRSYSKETVFLYIKKLLLCLWKKKNVLQKCLGCLDFKIERAQLFWQN